MTAPRAEQLPSDLRAASSPLAAPPAEELKVAKGLFVWRTIDAEPAELTHDSLLDGAGAAARGRRAGRGCARSRSTVSRSTPRSTRRTARAG